MKNKFLVYSLWCIVFLLSTIYYLPSTIFAADSSPSATIQSKLDELKKEIASKAAKLKQEVNNRLQNKAYLGVVQTKSTNSLTLATQRGAKIISLNQDTVFQSKIKTIRSLSLQNIKEEDFLVGLGDIDDTGVLVAKKIILMVEPKETQKTHLWGQVISISDQLITVKDKGGSSVAAVNDSDTKVKVNDFVIISGIKKKNDILEASFIYVISQGGVIKPKKVATPSARISTPSATLKPSPTPGKKN